MYEVWAARQAVDHGSEGNSQVGLRDVVENWSKMWYYVNQSCYK